MRRDLSAPIAPAPLPADIALVPFTADIAPACRELMDRVYAEAFGEAMPFAVWWPWVSGDAEYDPSMMFVAAAEGTIVAFCHGWRDAFIKDLVVDGEWRRRGLGGALLTLALADYARRGHPSVDLKTDVDNLTAQSLYTRLGFAIVERVEPDP